MVTHPPPPPGRRPLRRLAVAALALLFGLCLATGHGQSEPELTPGTGTLRITFVVSHAGDGYLATSRHTHPPVDFSGTLKTVVESAAQELMLAGGGHIVFTAGVFDLGADWLELDDLAGITFSGQGIDATIITNDADADTDTEPFDFVRSDHITLRDMTVAAGGPPRSTSDAIDFDGGDFIVVERVKVVGSRGRGIVFDGKGGLDGETHADHNIVRDCIITGVPGDGIELLASSYNLIEGCLISDVGGSGINIAKASAVADQVNKPSDHNRVIANTIHSAGADGIRINSGSNNIVSRNVVIDSSSRTPGRDGIRIFSVDAVPCNGNVIQLNTVTDTRPVTDQKFGVHVRDETCYHTLILENTVSGNLAAEIRDNGSCTLHEGKMRSSDDPLCQQGGGGA